MKSDYIRVMGARPSLLCYVHTSEHSRENAFCHLIDRDYESILISCNDQSNGTLHLLLYMYTKQLDGDAPITRIRSDFTEKKMK